MEPYLERVRERNDIENIIIGLGNLGELYHMMGELDKAREMIEEKIHLSKTISDKKALCNAMYNMGNIFITDGAYSKALQMAVDALKIAEELNLITQKAENALLAAQAACETGNADAGLEFAERALLYGNEGNMKDIITGSSIVISVCRKGSDSEHELLKMLDEAESDEQKALIHKSLYKVTGKEMHRQHSIDIFRQAYSSMPNYRYKIEIERLESESNMEK